MQGGIKVAIRATSTKSDLIVYTGSTEKGKLVAQAASKNLVPCILELGSKSPLIVDKSADIAYTALKVAFGSFLNYGQTCIRPDYCLVEYTVVVKFVEELDKQLRELYNGGKNKDLLGHSINSFHYDRVCALLADHKGTVVAGNPNAHIDKKLEPTIVLNPSPNSPLMKEEIFGPIVPILTYKTIDEAIKIIKGQEKPLVIYFFGKDSNDFNSSKMRLMTGTSSGAFVVNDVGV